MRVTVLGNNGPFPEPGGACSAYLFSHGGQNVLCDLGSGSLNLLTQLIHPELLDGILLTHMHFDHISDYLVLKYYFAALKARNMLYKKIPLYLPKDSFYSQVADDSLFDVVCMQEDKIFQLDELIFRFAPTHHPVLCYSVSAQTKTQKIVYTSDTLYTEKIVKFSHKADLLIADCGLLNGQKGFHLTAGECGRLAKEAQVNTLLLSHLNPLNDHLVALGQAREYHANTHLAERMQEYA